MPITFAPATKAQAKARVALAGPTGSGKTFTALRLATGLIPPGGRIALLDTEHGSASKYADLFHFDTQAINSYDPRVLIEALAVAGASGYEAFIADSLSHFWMGADGMLELVDKAAKRSGGGNSFAGWKEARPIERKMIDALLSYPGHVIVTMRSKTEWVIEENDRGKKVPRKIGLKAEQRDGIEYEFDVVGDMDQENTLVVTKSRCHTLSGAVIQRPDEELGRTLRTWLDDGTASGPSALDLRDQALELYATRDELYALYQRAQAAGILGAPVVDGSGDATTLGELIAQQGRAAAARASTPPAAERLPVDTDLAEEQLLTRLDAALTGDARISDEQEKLDFCNAIIAPATIDSTKQLTRGEVFQVLEAVKQGAAEDKTEVPAA